MNDSSTTNERKAFPYLKDLPTNRCQTKKSQTRPLQLLNWHSASSFRIPINRKSFKCVRHLFIMIEHFALLFDRTFLYNYSLILIIAKPLSLSLSLSLSHLSFSLSQTGSPISLSFISLNWLPLSLPLCSQCYKHLPWRKSRFRQN